MVETKFISISQVSTLDCRGLLEPVRAYVLWLSAGVIREEHETSSNLEMRLAVSIVGLGTLETHGTKVLRRVMLSSVIAETQLIAN